MLTNWSRTLIAVAPPGPAVPSVPVVKKGALGAWTLAKGPVILWETAYEMSYNKESKLLDEKKR